MNKIVHRGNVALEEYVIAGNRISILEGVLYFGVSNPYEAIRRLKKKVLWSINPLSQWQKYLPELIKL